MNIKIKDLSGKRVLWSGDADSLQEGLIAAVKSKADLTGADLTGADLSRADLTGADMSRANLYRANLYRADLYMANLSGANLSWANLNRADLSWANLNMADLSWAKLNMADLYWANLSGANLSKADLYMARLSRANLKDAEELNHYAICQLLILKWQVGPIRLAKLVTKEEGSPFQKRFVLSFKDGDTVEEPDFNSDQFEECGAGINLCTFDWAIRNWKEGMRIKICETTAQDIVCVPLGGEGKIRVSRCKVIGDADLEELGIVKKEEKKS